MTVKPNIFLLFSFTQLDYADAVCTDTVKRRDKLCKSCPDLNVISALAYYRDGINLFAPAFFCRLKNDANPAFPNPLDRRAKGDDVAIGTRFLRFARILAAVKNKE